MRMKAFRPLLLALTSVLLTSGTTALAGNLSASLSASPTSVNEGSSSTLTLSLSYTPASRGSGSGTQTSGSTQYRYYYGGSGYIGAVSGTIAHGDGGSSSISGSSGGSSFAISKSATYNRPGSYTASSSGSATCYDRRDADVYYWYDPTFGSGYWRYSYTITGWQYVPTNLSIGAGRSVTVVNRNPTLTNYSWTQPVIAGLSFDFTVTATDPGGVASNETMTFNFDLDNDGAYDDLTKTGSLTATGTHTIATAGTHPIGVQVTDGLGGTTTGSFNVTVGNDAPTIETIEPTAIECVGGVHTVNFSTTIGDANGHVLDAKWLVQNADGVFEEMKAETGLATGAEISFEHDYPHGESAVRLEVFDGYDTTIASTTVTVQDTELPIVIVAADVEVPTDPGKAFASNVTLTPPTATDESGHPVTVVSDAPETYPLGETIVTWTATDSDGNQATGAQKVKVVDEEAPKLPALPDVRRFCDPAKLFATVELRKPTATDNVPGKVVVTTPLKKQFRIGKTRVVWTATDAAGNKTTKTQNVIVINRRPKANAGKNVTITTTSEKGARVVLDGRLSSDPDKHALKYAWRAPKVKLTPATAPKTSGLFPVGTRVVTLTVTDAGGLKHADTLTVTVKLKNGKRRPRGSDANRSFAYAAQHAGSAAANGVGNDAVISGLAYASAASAYGDAAGEFVRWEEGQSEADALIAYAQLRTVQATYGEAAAQALLAAYAETGDDHLLAAYCYAAYGTAYAAADLTEE